MSCLICDESVTASAREDIVTSTEIINRFVQQLGVQGQGLEVILCEDCLSGVVKATQWGEQVGVMERNVRDLQQIILKMVRQLESLQGNYLEEMRRLEGKIRNIGRGSPGSGAVAGGSSEKKEGRACIPDKAEVFRQGILDVVVDLSAFQDGLVTQIGGSSPPEVAELAAKNNTTNSDQPTGQQQQESPLKSVIKQEVESGSLAETGFALGGQEEEESLSILDPHSAENDDSIDIEHVVCSEDLFKTEPVVDYELPVPVTPTATTSRRAKSERKKGTAARLRHVCQFCGKAFTKSSDLKRHVYTHTGERPHKCHLCPMAFKKREHLTRHLMVHSGKKPFRCPHCQKRFVRKDQLQQHKRTHGDETPHQCQVCGQEFRWRKSLNKHVKTEHPSNPPCVD